MTYIVMTEEEWIADAEERTRRAAWWRSWRAAWEDIGQVVFTEALARRWRMLLLGPLEVRAPRLPLEPV